MPDRTSRVVPIHTIHIQNYNLMTDTLRELNLNSLSSLQRWAAREQFSPAVGYNGLVAIRAFKGAHSSIERYRGQSRLKTKYIFSVVTDDNYPEPSDNNRPLIWTCSETLFRKIACFLIISDTNCIHVHRRGTNSYSFSAFIPGAPLPAEENRIANERTASSREISPQSGEVRYETPTEGLLTSPTYTTQWTTVSHPSTLTYINPPSSTYQSPSTRRRQRRGLIPQEVYSDAPVDPIMTTPPLFDSWHHDTTEYITVTPDSVRSLISRNRERLPVTPESLALEEEFFSRDGDTPTNNGEGQ